MRIKTEDFHWSKDHGQRNLYETAKAVLAICRVTETCDWLELLSTSPLGFNEARAVWPWYTLQLWRAREVDMRGTLFSPRE